MGLSAFTEALLVLAVISPLLAGALLSGEADKGQESLASVPFPAHSG